MKLYRFELDEIDFFAANDEAEARKLYQSEYGLHDREMDEVDVSLVADPTTIQIYPDGWDYDSDDEPPTAADEMASMKRPGLVATSAV